MPPQPTNVMRIKNHADILDDSMPNADQLISEDNTILFHCANTKILRYIFVVSIL